MKAYFQQIRQRNFTLIELLIVIAIIAILMGIGIGVMSIAMNKASENATKSLLAQLETALESYKAEEGYYFQQSTAAGFYIKDDDTAFIKRLPSYEKLKANNMTEIGTGTGKYALVDSFGTQIVYKCPGDKNRTKFDLRSKGSDTKDRADDISIPLN
jgi:general secretion pathway protein G